MAPSRTPIVYCKKTAALGNSVFLTLLKFCAEFNTHNTHTHNTHKKDAFIFYQNYFYRIAKTPIFYRFPGINTYIYFIQIWTANRTLVSTWVTFRGDRINSNLDILIIHNSVKNVSTKLILHILRWNRVLLTSAFIIHQLDKSLWFSSSLVLQSAG